MSLIFQISNKNNVARIPAKIETQKLYIEMLLNVCEYFLSNSKNITCYYKYDPQLFDILIIDDRMFIFFSNDKYVSAYFPFHFNKTSVIFHT